jgi:hypothetical protein
MDEAEPKVARPVGRPPKVTVDPAIASAICERLCLGMPLVLAAEAVNVPRSTVRDWIKSFPEFSAQITCARAAGAEFLTRYALAGGPGSGHALRLLERRYYKHYGKVEEKTDRAEVRIVVEGGLPRRRSP